MYFTNQEIVNYVSSVIRLSIGIGKELPCSPLKESPIASCIVELQGKIILIKWQQEDLSEKVTLKLQLKKR